jgi:hypothetical protein
MAQDGDDPRRDQPPAVTSGAAQDAAPVDVLHPRSEPVQPLPPYLLAVDCGLHIGLALFAENGRLLWYRSHHLGDRAHLKRAAARVLGGLPGLQQLVVEGGGTLADLWARAAQQRGVAVRRVHAEQWRVDLLHPRQQRSGRQAKQVADELARSIIAQTGAGKPKALRHDAAEAILIGWWALTARAPHRP